MKLMEYTALFVKSGDWWAATIEEIPGVNSQGKTLDEARENLKEALELVLSAVREDVEAMAEGAEVVKETIRAKAS